MKVSAVLKRSRLRAVVLAVVLIAGACSGTGESATSSSLSLAVSTTSTFSVSSGVCPESAVGIHPPADVVMIGDVEVTVPFDSWQCPGRNVDNFVTPSDYPVPGSDGGVTVRFDSTSIASFGARMWNDANAQVEVSVIELEPGLVQIQLPDPNVSWTIRLRLDGENDRVAYYTASLIP